MSLARAKQRRAASPLGRVFGTGVTCNQVTVHSNAFFINIIDLGVKTTLQKIAMHTKINNFLKI